MSAALHQLLLVVALAAAGDAAIRLAGLTGAMGLERVLAAAPLAAAYAVSSALVLGLAGLGGNPWVLTATSIVTWGAARFALPRQSSSLLAEVRSRARSLSARTRVLAWALGGVAVAWTVGIVLRPAIGSDGVVYHLTEIVGWVRSGHPGSVQSITYEFPVGSYPLTHEVLLSWATAISRSFAPAALAGPAFLALGCAALGHALRRLAVPGFLIGLGLAAFASSPIVADQVAGPNTDLPAVVWLAVAGALSLSVAARPAILGPAILAGALAVGTKTTALPLAAVALGLGLWWGRAALRRLAVPLAACAGAGLLAGGLWYVRNLVVHGSPLWPFTSGPWGDPVPALIDKLRFSFIERPVATLHDRLHLYVEMLAGFGPLIAAALVAPFTARGRALRLAGVVSALSLLAWASAPVTGIPDDRQADLTLTTLRYLLPVAAMAIVTVALAGRGGPRRRALAAAVFVVVAGWNVARDLHVGLPVSEPGWLLVGGLGAVLAGEALARAAPRVPLRRARAGVAIAFTVASVAALELVGHGFVERHGRATGFDSPAVRWFAGQPDFQRGHRPVASVGLMFGVLAGDRLQHPLELVPAEASCADLRGRAISGWLVVRQRAPASRIDATARTCLADVAPAYSDAQVRVYRLGSRQTATRSSASLTSPARSSKSSTEMASARGSGTRRARVRAAS